MHWRTLVIVLIAIVVLVWLLIKYGHLIDESAPQEVDQLPKDRAPAIAPEQDPVCRRWDDWNGVNQYPMDYDCPDDLDYEPVDDQPPAELPVQVEGQPTPVAVGLAEISPLHAGHEHLAEGRQRFVIPPPAKPLIDISARLPKKISKGQALLSRILEEETGHEFFFDQWPEWLVNPKTNRRLQLDCSCPTLAIAGEYQGKNHYVFSEHFHGTVDKFHQQVARDDFKRRKCDECGMYLVTVPYWVRFDKMRDFVRQQLEYQFVLPSR